jgi:hypothetical protein
MREVRTSKTPFTSVKFKCDILKKMFTPGTRVMAECYDVSLAYDHGSGKYPSSEEAEIEGTVMSWWGEKLIICLDESWHYDGKYHLKCWPDRLSLLNQPKASVCSTCGHPLDRLKDQTHYCEECNPGDGEVVWDNG